jgi:hypothetical protein
MRRRTFDDQNDHEAPQHDAPSDYRCPARGCPNAASVSVDHGRRWACFAHAKAEPLTWPAVTQAISDDWPASCNWGHPDKLAHEARMSAERSAKLPQRRVIGGLSLGDALGSLQGVAP